LGRQQAAGAARGQAAEQGVKPTDRLRSQPGEVVVPVRQQPQHRGVIHRGDPPQPAVPQRHDRRGPGVVRVGLVGATSVERPDPSRQCRRHIQHRLAGGDQLLCQQRTQPRGRLDGPRAGRKAGGETQQLVSLLSVRADPQLADHGLGAVEHRCGVSPLWGSIPMINTKPSSWLSQW
jgi:hypothetical protein